MFFGRLFLTEPALERDLRDLTLAESSAPLSSSSQSPLPSSTSSSLASDMTTTSDWRARRPCSMSMLSLSPIQSIYKEDQGETSDPRYTNNDRE